MIKYRIIKRSNKNYYIKSKGFWGWGRASRYDFLTYKAALDWLVAIKKGDEIIAEFSLEDIRKLI